jgi:DNA-binding CsgD family transcriptional regulator
MKETMRSKSEDKQYNGSIFTSNGSPASNAPFDTSGFLFLFAKVAGSLLGLGLVAILIYSLQDILQAACCLQKEEHALRLEFTCPETASLPEPVQNAIRQRIAPFGGKWSLGRLADGQAHLVVNVPLRQELSFTRRESQVLAGLAQGWSNKEIARRLSISPRTVNYHLDHIFAKLGVLTRTEAAVIALRQGWVSNPSPDEGPSAGPG